MAAASVALGFGGITRLLGSATPYTLDIPEWPRLRLSNLKEIHDHKWYLFTYPSSDIPNILVRHGKPVPGGVVPSHDITAYYMTC